MSTDDAWDLVVIGCGPGGEKAAAQAAYFGKRVAVVDTLPVGGACAHTGTLPSKALRESALQFSGIQQLGIHGLRIHVTENIAIDELMAHKEHICKTEVERILGNLERHNISLIGGHAYLEDAKTVRVKLNEGGERVLQSEVVILATGTRPFRPEGFPFDGKRVFDSNDILNLDRVPKSLIVYGAGVIGCEYAGMFSALGVNVTLVEPRDTVLPFLDSEIAQTLLHMFKKRGMVIKTGAPFQSCEIAGENVELTLHNGAVLKADALFFAAGRSGNTTNLGLENIGLSADKRGLLKVDEHYQTSVDGVYAVGDVIGFPALASTSMEQGRIAACHAFDFQYKQELAQYLPYGIYTIPECGFVGATEEELKQSGVDYVAGHAHYRDNARGQLSGCSDGMLKLLCHRGSRKVLGVHVVGERASDLVHTGLTVMQLAGTFDTFIDGCYNYPTLTELYKYAAYDLLGQIAKN